MPRCASSELRSALGAITEIPTETIWADWLHSIVSASKEINASMSDHWASAAASRARRHAEAKPEPSFHEGDLVLLSKPFFEKGLGAILPQCDGPYTISRLPTLHTAILVDTLTNEPILDGKPLSVARLIRFEFPQEWAGAEAVELDNDTSQLSKVRRGDFVCVAPRTSQYHRTYVAHVERVFQGQQQLEVTLYWVPPAERCGPWKARRWQIWSDEAGNPRKEIITCEEFICIVTLQNNALTHDSLEALTLHGILASGTPHRDASLPARLL